MSTMLEEIREQPAALERTLRAGVQAARELARALRNRPRLVLLAARGTSDNAARFGRYLLEITTGIPVSLAAPSIGTLYRARLDLRDALVVAISQSGESTDTNLVLERARKSGVPTVGITNEPRSALAGLAEHVFPVAAGRELSVAATKTYTSQLMMLYVLARALGAGIRLEDLRRLPEQAAAALKLEADIARRAGSYRSMERGVVIGRGLNYANAFEFALKLMETCYVAAQRFSAADFLHGPIAMIERSFPVFVFAPAGVTWPGTRDVLARLRTLRAQTMVITDSGHRRAVADHSGAVVIPARVSGRELRPDDLLTPIPYIIPAQLFAASLAEAKGLDPDRPRALAKITRTL
jgi:glucosamine--fructose-6-phosphate aminotransferase (isomerizing)